MRALLVAAAVVVFGPGGAAHAQGILKIGYVTTKEAHFGVGATVFCDEVDRATEGRWRCRHFPNSVLGGESEMIEAVKLGTLDMVNTSTGPLGNFIPEVRIVDLPFLFRDYDHARKVLDGPIGQELLAKFPPRGLVALAWTENGFRHLTNSRRDIVTPADAAGLKLRTMENKVHIEGFRAFGVLPTPLPFPEVYDALKQGTVDGQENPIPMILSAKFGQVQKHLSLTAHVYSPALLLISPRTWSKVSDADRKAFVDAAKKAAAAQRRKVNDDEAVGIAQLEREGVTVVRNVDRAAFRDAVRPMYAEYAKEFGAENIRRIREVH